MRNKYDPFVNTLALLYGLIPIIIFFLGWLRPIVSIPATLVLGYSASVYTKRVDQSAAAAELKINWLKTGLILLLGFAWVYCSGIGGYTNQDWDHHGRNA